VTLLPENLPDNPLPLLEQWLNDAMKRANRPNPNSFTLATVNHDGQPSARVLLCKELVTEPGYLVFYTNYESAKALEMESQSRVAATFHWDSVGLQARIQGVVVRSPETESDEYFMSRDEGSKVGAWASHQSQPIESREKLFRQLQETEERLKATNQTDGIPRPPNWGGYRLWPETIELWVSSEARLHDRARWERKVAPGASDVGEIETSDWAAITRLQP
jgi:pyridoxamine 5'-phosphate oxidase